METKTPTKVARLNVFELVDDLKTAKERIPDNDCLLAVTLKKQTDGKFVVELLFDQSCAE